MRIALTRRQLVVVCAIGIASAVAILLGPRPQLVDGALVKRGPLRITADSEGRTRIRDTFVVSTPIAGYMQRIPFKPGDRIEKGNVITFIRPPEPILLPSSNHTAQKARLQSAEAQLEQARADLQRARSALSFAEVDLVRKKELRSAGAAAIRTAELAELDVKTKSAELDVVQKNVLARQAQVEVERAALIAPSVDIRTRTADERFVQITSPVSGTILKVTRENEDMVNPGAPIIEIGDPRNLEIMLEMLSTDAVKVKIDAPATIEGWGGDILTGRVRKIEPAGFTKVSALGVEEQRVVIVLDFTDPPELWATLSHGYRVNAKILIWDSPDVLKVRAGALFRKKNRWMVYVVENGVAASRSVEIDRSNGVEAELKDGVKEGDIVILHPSDQITDGMPVQVRDAP